MFTVFAFVTFYGIWCLSRCLGISMNDDLIIGATISATIIVRIISIYGNFANKSEFERAIERGDIEKHPDGLYRNIRTGDAYTRNGRKC